MLARLGRRVVRHRRAVLGGLVVVIVVAAVLGRDVERHLTVSGTEDPSSESSRAAATLARDFHQQSPNFVVLVRAKVGTVDDPRVVATGAALGNELAHEPGVQAFSYWGLGSPPQLRSRDRRAALIVATVSGGVDAVQTRMDRLARRYTRTSAVASSQVGGSAFVFRETTRQTKQDLSRAETLSLPLVLILLVLVAGSILAAGMPIAVGLFGIVMTFLVLRVLSSITDVSVFALNLTTALGLALAMDYSLLLLGRFREELHAGRDPDEAAMRTVETAGHTVAVSAATVMASLCALLVFPLSFLRSFAYAGVAVVGLVALGAIVFLPAMLAAVGHRLESTIVFRSHVLRAHVRANREGFWHRMARVVMRYPLPIAISVIVLLLFLGFPFLRATFGLPDDRVLPPGTPARLVPDQLRSRFAGGEADAASVVTGPLGLVAQRHADIDRYARDLSRLAGVARVDALTGSYSRGVLIEPPGLLALRFSGTARTWLSVVPSVVALSPAGEQLVRAIRHGPSPFPVAVAGPSAQLVDTKSAVFGRAPLAGLLIAAVTFVILFLLFGSVFLPVKAVILNVLSLSATFGAMVWVFQDGHLAGSLNFTPTGTIDTTVPILMFCVAFGLSMDYEVFLLSRVQEEYERTHDNVEAVAWGLERTGRIVTAAAALLAIVFIAFGTSGVTLMKLLGLGLALAVLMDATLVRATLVPALMRLAGAANWWAPRWLRPVHERLGISREDPVAAIGTTHE